MRLLNLPSLLNSNFSPSSCVKEFIFFILPLPPPSFHYFSVFRLPLPPLHFSSLFHLLPTLACTYSLGWGYNHHFLLPGVNSDPLCVEGHMITTNACFGCGRRMRREIVRSRSGRFLREFWMQESPPTHLTPFLKPAHCTDKKTEAHSGE